MRVACAWPAIVSGGNGNDVVCDRLRGVRGDGEALQLEVGWHILMRTSGEGNGASAQRSTIIAGSVQEAKESSVVLVLEVVSTVSARCGGVCRERAHCYSAAR